MEWGKEEGRWDGGRRKLRKVDGMEEKWRPRKKAMKSNGRLYNTCILFNTCVMYIVHVN